jgi:ribulose kinase
MRDLLIGIDGGTGGLRVYIFDSRGNVISSAESPYTTDYPQNGWAEQSPRDWKTALVVAVREALNKGSVNAERIVALCAATTSCTVLTCDRNGNALDNAILWMDVRASRESADFEKIAGQKLSAELFLSKILWLRRNRRELYDRAEIICEYQDYLNYYLTGRWCFSVNTACNWGYDRRKTGFDEPFYRLMGMEDVLPKLPPKAVRPGEAVGFLTESSAGELGLDTGVMVVQGGIDSSIGMLGMGIARPGSIALMTGSSNLVMAITKEPLFSAGNEVNLGPDFLIEGFYTSFRGQASTGSMLAWFIREFCREMDDDAFNRLDSMAADISPGSGGLMVLDYMQGNRTPYNDPDARGLIYGLSMQTSREQIYRALMESIAFGTEDILEAFRLKGEKIDLITVSGGAVRSGVFLSIYADVCGVRFRVSSDYSVALGGAVCAARASGMYPSLMSAADHMVSFGTIIEPDAERYRVYRKFLDKYRTLYPAIREWVKK